MSSFSFSFSSSSSSPSPSASIRPCPRHLERKRLLAAGDEDGAAREEWLQRKAKRRRESDLCLVALHRNHVLYMGSSSLPPLPRDAGSVGSVDPTDPTPTYSDPASGDGSYDFVMLSSSNGGRGVDGTTTESSIDE
ncbi:hypothetical protein GUJ93_ZPchr0012g22182 [Zizania palustris]|uniref:Uncharacterized protein n=1 Tax=Zizania palustris TaxID=103762 RepID=A0A8J5WPH7_ZIZPA|nr:hypothetical protein GUJ93_ZPchr0012g22182 [Zizania palustris]